MPNQRHVGTLKVYDPIKGYGFITRPIGRDVFVFFRDFAHGGDVGALPGASVEFDIVEKPGSGRQRAVNVTIVG
jgi:cold shock protein